MHIMVNGWLSCDMQSGRLYSDWAADVDLLPEQAGLTGQQHMVCEAMADAL